MQHKFSEIYKQLHHNKENCLIYSFNQPVQKKCCRKKNSSPCFFAAAFFIQQQLTLEERKSYPKDRDFLDIRTSVI